MKLLLLLLSTAAALPQRGGEPQQGKEEGGEDPGTIIRCMAENWAAGEARIQACRDCFTAVGDLATQAGLQAAKEQTRNSRDEQAYCISKSPERVKFMTFLSVLKL